MHRLSIVIPFYNEGSIASEVLREVRGCCPGAEIIAVDDGSDDGTWEGLCAVEGVRAIRLNRNCGQSAALSAGWQRASRPLCATMDGDGQNDPEDFHRMLAYRDAAGFDVICGHRVLRRDTFLRRASSRVANGLRRRVFADGIHDTGCAMRIFPRSAVATLTPFNGMHRFLPPLFLNAGLTVGQIPVHHRPRAGGTSKYKTWDRACRGLVDLFGVSWLLRRQIHYPSIEDTVVPLHSKPEPTASMSARQDA
jgi:dolichol-phosphate mannosyltransferase